MRGGGSAEALGEVGLQLLDWTILGLYFGSILWIGWHYRRVDSQKTEFFLAGRSMSTVAVLLSVIATEISAVTFLGVPSVAFAGDFHYLQFGLGSMAARFVVAGIFLPAFYKNRCETPYAWLEERFDALARKTGAVFFLVSRLNASGVRLLLAAGGIGYFFSWSIPLAVTLFCLLSFAYTSLGGLRAVIRTDAVQAAVFIAGGIAAGVYLVGELGVPQGWDLVLEEEKFRVFHLDLPEGGLMAVLSDARWFWIAFVNGLFMTVAALGCDQDLTQRLLSCRTLKEAKRSVVFSGLLGIPVAGLFLFVGAGLYQFYSGTPPETLPDREFAFFILNDAPAGLKGLLVAGILAAAMSSLDSAMNALSSSVWQDFGKRYRGRADRAGRGYWSLESPRGVVLLAIILLWGVAMGFHLLQKVTGENLLWLGFQTAGLTLGPMLGVFSFGLAAKSKRSGKMVTLSMLGGLGYGILLLVQLRLGWIPLAWTWVIFLASLLTVLLLAVSPRSKKAEEIGVAEGGP